MISNLICLNNSRILRKNTAVNFTAVFRIMAYAQGFSVG